MRVTQGPSHSRTCVGAPLKCYNCVPVFVDLRARRHIYQRSDSGGDYLARWLSGLGPLAICPYPRPSLVCARSLGHRHTLSTVTVFDLAGC